MNNNGFKILIDMVDGLDDHVKTELAFRLKRRSPVDSGELRNSYTIEDDGIHSSDYADKIEALEDGHSQQRPNGWIRSTIEEVPSIVKKYVDKESR